MQKRYVIYQRVSTEEQVRNGYSLEAMLEKCQHYIASQEDAVLVKVCADEGYSGTLPPSKRPALDELLSDASSRANNFDAVIVWKLDRLSRSLRDTLNIEHILMKAGKSLESVMERLDTSTAAGRMFFNTVASFAEFESAQIGERTWATMSSQVGKKHLGGKPAMGYSLKGEALEINEKDAETVRLIFGKFLRLKGYNRVAKYLNERQIFTSNGKKWSHRQVGKILTNPVYLGDLVWNRTNRRKGIVNSDDRWVIKESTHEAIISRNIFDRVQQLIG